MPFDIEFGDLKPTMINQIKPGNLVNGIRKSNFGKAKLNQLASPKKASTIPDTTNHFGNSFIKPAVTEMPAIKRPNGTE